MFALGLPRLALGQWNLPLSAGGGAPAVPGATSTDFAALGLTPALHYHPNTESVTLDGSSRLTAVSANATSPALTPSATGPLEQTDLRGIKRWRFEGSQYLDVPNTFLANPRGCTVFMVSRVHKHANTNNLFSISYQSDGTTALAGGATLRCVGSGNTAPWLYNSGIASSGSATNKEYMVPGSQLQAIGLASRTTANGGSKFWINGKPSSTLAQSGVTATGTKGARICGYVSSNGTTNFDDVYEIVVFNTELTDVQAQAVADALVANWAIAEITQNLVLDGDSITDGIVEVTSGSNLAMALTEPGADLIPANVRVLNMAKSGASVVDLITRRDAVNGWPAIKIGSNANDNKIGGQVGRNDYSTFKTANPGWTEQQVADEIYSGATGGSVNNILAYHNTAVTGTVARGWKPVQACNIQNGTNDNNGLELLAGKIASLFTTDVAGSGIINPRLITVGGVSIFDYPLQTAHYQASDTTHPNILGTAYMASGGDTPQYGYGGIF